MRRSISSEWRLALQQRAQQQLVDAEREREQADDPGAPDLEAVDGHRGHHRAGDLPRQHRHEHAAEHLRQRAAAQDARVAGDHQEVQEVRGEEDDEHRDRVAALLGVCRCSASSAIPPSSGNVVYVSEVVEQVRAADLAAQRVDERGREPEQRRRRRAEQRHRQHEAGERARRSGSASRPARGCRTRARAARSGRRAGAAPTGSRSRGSAASAEHDDQQHALGDRRGAVAGRRRARVRQPAVRGRRGGISHRGGPHDGERPDDEAKPDDQCEPDDHSEQR